MSTGPPRLPGKSPRLVFQLQEALLGALRRFDETDDFLIHPSSLQQALESMGVNYGDVIVDQCVLHACLSTDTLVVIFVLSFVA